MESNDVSDDARLERQNRQSPTYCCRSKPGFYFSHSQNFVEILKILFFSIDSCVDGVQRCKMCSFVCAANIRSIHGQHYQAIGCIELESNDFTNSVYARQRQSFPGHRNGKTKNTIRLESGRRYGVRDTSNGAVQKRPRIR